MTTFREYDVKEYSKLTNRKYRPAGAMWAVLFDTPTGLGIEYVNDFEEAGSFINLLKLGKNGHQYPAGGVPIRLVWSITNIGHLPVKE